MKTFLKTKVVDYKLIIIDFEKYQHDMINWLLERYEIQSFPAIFINGEFIGGYHQLKSMHSTGELAKALGKKDVQEQRLHVEKHEESDDMLRELRNWEEK